MLSPDSSSHVRSRLCSKPLLNISESRYYLGLSRRDFQALEQSDPSFPKRKTKTKHSRELLDAWLKINGSTWWTKETPSPLGTRASKFKISLDQLN